MTAAFRRAHGAPGGCAGSGGDTEGTMNEADARSGQDLARSKRAAERHRKAKEAVEAAKNSRDRVNSLFNLSVQFAVLSRQDEKSYQEELAKLEAQWRQAAEVEKRALDELAEATEEFNEATAKPRVEAEKLRFEEHKLRATLSSTSIVGIAAVSGILFPVPDGPSYIWVLVVSFGFLFVSMVLSMEAMKKSSQGVEETLISADVSARYGIRAFLIRHIFTFGLAVFAIFLTLNLAL